MLFEMENVNISLGGEMVLGCCSIKGSGKDKLLSVLRAVVLKGNIKGNCSLFKTLNAVISIKLSMNKNV